MPEEKISPEPAPEPQPVVEPVSEPEISEIPPKPVTNRLKIILLAVLGLVIVGGLIYVGYKLGQKQAKLGPTPTPVVVATPTPDPTADWETYTNQTYGYSIKYPTDYFVSATEEGVEFTHNKWKGQVVSHPYVSIEVFETKYSTDEWAKQEIKGKREGGFGVFEEGCEMHCVSATAKEVRIGNNIRALQYRVWGVSGGGEYIVVEKGSISNSNRLIVIYSHIAGGRDPGEESVPIDILDKMFSTFKFLEEENQGTSEEEIICDEPRPEVCTMECISPPPYICGSNGKLYCNKCAACADWKVDWYIIQNKPCGT